jgi:hypothetical protein
MLQRLFGFGLYIVNWDGEGIKILGDIRILLRLLWRRVAPFFAIRWRGMVLFLFKH